MRNIVAAMEGEYRRYKRLGEGALSQLDAGQLGHQPTSESNSLATIVWHIAGNLESRFTDFLTTDGEKEWRRREEEFAVRDATPEEVLERWEQGFTVLFGALSQLADTDLPRSITIRGVDHTVAEALSRSLAHTSYHVGQMTYVGKMLAGPKWKYLTIPPGGTAAYNRDPNQEKEASAT